jgi:hypothetical protein
MNYKYELDKCKSQGLNCVECLVEGECHFMCANSLKLLNTWLIHNQRVGLFLVVVIYQQSFP